MIVMLVLIANCHVSLNEKSGPDTSQTTMTPTASANVRGRPQKREAFFANCEYQATLRIQARYWVSGVSDCATHSIVSATSLLGVAETSCAGVPSRNNTCGQHPSDISVATLGRVDCIWIA
jgi:hypothetical protein